MEKIKSEYQVTDWSNGLDGGAPGIPAEEVLERGWCLCCFEHDEFELPEHSDRPINKRGQVYGHASANPGEAGERDEPSLLGVQSVKATEREGGSD